MHRRFSKHLLETGELPAGFDRVRHILSEIDVIWVASGRNDIEGLYEIEHSTPVYSGLLRFNDVLLTDPRVSRFSIVSNDSRRELFSRQLLRPTFRQSGLAELCSFMEYKNVLPGTKDYRKEGLMRRNDTVQRIYTVVEVWRGMAVGATNFRHLADAEKFMDRVKCHRNLDEDDVQLFKGNVRPSLPGQQRSR